METITLRYAAECRHCARPLNVGERATCYRSTPEFPDEEERPGSFVAHPLCPTTIDLGPQTLRLMLPPGMSLDSNAARAHLAQFSTVSIEPMPAGTAAELRRLKIAYLELDAIGRARIRADHQRWLELACDIKRIHHRYPSRAGQVEVDVRNWYRLHEHTIAAVANRG